MALLRRFESGVPNLQPQGGTVKQYDAAKKESPNNLSKPADLITNAEKLAESSNGRYTADDAKYVIAVREAQNRFKDVGDVDDARMKQEIDDIFENELEAGEGAGRRIRGENGFTDAINGIKGALDGINNTVGGAMDAAFDTVVAKPAGWFDPEFGETLENVFDGEDLSIIPDIAMDVGLSAIPYLGVPLVMAKNAIQQADTIAEAMSGKDNITREDLTDNQKAGKTASSLGTIALSAIPGAGVTKNAIKQKGIVNEGLEQISKAFEKNPTEVKEVSDRLIGLIPKNASESEVPAVKALQDTLKNSNAGIEGQRKTVNEASESVLKKLAEQNPDEVKKGLEEANKNLRDKYKGPGYVQGVKDSLGEARELLKKDYNKINGINDEIGDLRIKKRDAKTKSEKREFKDRIAELKQSKGQYDRHPIMAARKAMDGLIPAKRSTEYMRSLENIDSMDRAVTNPFFNSASEYGPLKSLTNFAETHPIINQAANYARNGALLGAVGIANEMGQSGANPYEALVLGMNRLANDPAKYGPMMIPIMARGLARKNMPNLAGKYRSDTGYQALRANAVSDRLSDISQSDINESYDEDEMLARLKNAIDRNNNGTR